MYTHILIPTDGSELSKMALRAGVELAKTLGARVTVVTVTTPFHDLGADATLSQDPDQYAKHVTALAGRCLASAKKIAAIAGVPCSLVHAEHQHPYQAIIDTAKNHSGRQEQRIGRAAVSMCSTREAKNNSSCRALGQSEDEIAVRASL